MSTPTRSRPASAVRALVVGLGQVLAGDDAAGPAVVARLRARAPEGLGLLALAEPLALLHHLDGVSRLVVVDAVRAPQPPGTVLVLDAADLPAGAGAWSTGSHGVGLPEVLALAATTTAGRPRCCTVVGVVGRSFEPGEPMSADVATALDTAVDRVLSLVSTPAPA